MKKDENKQLTSLWDQCSQMHRQQHDQNRNTQHACGYCLVNIEKINK